MEGEEYMQKNVETTVGVPYPLGVSYQNQTLNFAYISEHDNCGVILYDKVTKNQIGKYLLIQYNLVILHTFHRTRRVKCS